MDRNQILSTFIKIWENSRSEPIVANPNANMFDHVEYSIAAVAKKYKHGLLKETYTFVSFILFVLILNRYLYNVDSQPTWLEQDSRDN